MSLVGNITGFQHLGIPVSDIEKSINFYTSLGFRITIRNEIIENGGKTSVAFLDLCGFCIELFQSAAGKDVSRVNPGPIDHLTLDVRDISEAFEEIKAMGYEILEEAPVSLPLQKKGVKYFLILGPDGERVEFNQIL